MSYTLLFDAGNTNTKIGLADAQGIRTTYSLPTRPANTADDWGFKICRLLDRENVPYDQLTNCLVSSVVPPLDPLISRMAERYLGCTARFAGRDLPVPLENRYARPNEVGADILVGAYAARTEFAARNLIVVDFGTATTYACVMGNAFMGGLICPGVLSSMRSLAEGTAKLPAVDLALTSPKLTWGRTTSECLNQGLVHGFASMTEGLCERLAAQMDEKPLVVATGGLAEAINPVCNAIDEIRDDLLMDGLLLLAN